MTHFALGQGFGKTPRARGISAALQESFRQLDEEADAEMKRLIEQMKAFEGSKVDADG